MLNYHYGFPEKNTGVEIEIITFNYNDSINSLISIKMYTSHEDYTFLTASQRV